MATAIQTHHLDIKDEDNMHTYNLDTLTGLERVSLTPNFKEEITVINNRNFPINLNKPFYNSVNNYSTRRKVPVNFILNTNVSNVYYNNKPILEYKDNKLDSYEFYCKRGKCRCSSYDTEETYQLSFAIENANEMSDEKIKFISTLISSKSFKHH